MAPGKKIGLYRKQEEFILIYIFYSKSQANVFLKKSEKSRVIGTYLEKDFVYKDLYKFKEIDFDTPFSNSAKYSEEFQNDVIEGKKTTINYILPEKSLHRLCNVCDILRLKTEFAGDRLYCKFCKKDKNEKLENKKQIEQKMFKCTKCDENKNDKSRVRNTQICIDCSIDENTQYCKACKKVKNSIEFTINEKIFKQCNRCREVELKQKSKPEIKESRNKKQREAKYYVKYRTNKRNENETEYLKHNAEMAKSWRDKNLEHLSKWRKKNLNTRISSIKQQAKKKNIVWDKNMTNDVCINLVSSKCFYCGFLNKDNLNGIDRLDSSSNYTIDNCVSCCRNCNFIKRCLDPITFIKRCFHISNKFFDNKTYYNKCWPNNKSVNILCYKERAIKKNIVFELSSKQFNNLINDNCFYCNKNSDNNHKNGIDRKDNKLGYIITNCLTCCSECNIMKCNLDYNIFINHCKRVTVYHNDNNIDFETKFNFIKTNLKSMKNFRKKQKSNKIITNE